MVSIHDLEEVLRGLFNEPIAGPLKFKMAQIRHVENREIAIFQPKKSSYFDEIWYRTAELGDSQLTKYDK